ncbi:hypothetical protein [Azospirillum sp. INR13]|uniref:hypothetical protein n=1 Tax=Azospirillum sp. INR13 TaxID=2596919 RepID=UPI0021085C5D|nr:hypothetical protein [Azospirillum sp. INR13]
MLLMCVGLVVSLQSERKVDPGRRTTRAAASATAPAAETAGDGDWRQGLSAMLGRRSGQSAVPPGAGAARRNVARFIADDVVPALRDIAEELERNGRVVEIDTSSFTAGIAVLRDGQEEFSYAIRARAYHPMSFAFSGIEKDDEPWQTRAEVILRGGLHKQLPQERMNRSAIRHDFIREYGKWMGW